MASLQDAYPDALSNPGLRVCSVSHDEIVHRIKSSACETDGEHLGPHSIFTPLLTFYLDLLIRVLTFASPKHRTLFMAFLALLALSAKLR